MPNSMAGKLHGTLIKGLILALLLQFTAPIQAVGFSADSRQAGVPSRFSAEQIIGFAKKVQKVLADKGARVAIIARMGRPPSELPEGMHFTHAAFAVYSEITTSDGRKVPGYAIYNLYQNSQQPDTSSLVQDYPVDFFAGVAKLEAGVIIPSDELQDRLLNTIFSPAYAKLHEPKYSAIANPYTIDRQNCTEFVLDVVFSAIYEIDDPAKIKRAEKQYYVAQKVNVNPLKLMFGSMFSKEVALSDHEGAPETVTFESIARFLQKYDEGVEILTIFPGK